MQLRIPGTVVARDDGTTPDDFQLPPDPLHVRDAAFESQLLLMIMLISAR